MVECLQMKFIHRQAFLLTIERDIIHNTPTTVNIKYSKAHLRSNEQSFRAQSLKILRLSRFIAEPTFFSFPERRLTFNIYLSFEIIKGIHYMNCSLGRAYFASNGREAKS